MEYSHQQSRIQQSLHDDARLGKAAWAMAPGLCASIEYRSLARYNLSVPQLFHFSEDPTITLFRPSDSFVWAIDEAHAPSYWFPRDCPRACCWRGDSSLSETGAALLQSGCDRMHAIEAAWLNRVRDCRLYAYEFDPGPFRAKVSEAGYWVAQQDIVPLSVASVGDLLDRHVDAGIELRVGPNLWHLIDLIVASGLEFSIIRKANAQPRCGPSTTHAI